MGVSIAPIIPGLNDHEIPALLAAAAANGATSASGTVLRLPHVVKDIFAAWLDRFEPGRKELILGRIAEMRGGKLNDPTFGARMTGHGPLADQIARLLEVAKRRTGLDRPMVPLSTTSFLRRMPGQLELF